MADVPLPEMDKSRAMRGKAQRPRFLGGKPVHGFDTETSKGDVILLTRALEGKDPEAIHADGDPLPAEQLWSALCHRDLRGAVAVWYNLDFDANVLLKVLPEECLFQLQLTNSTMWEGAKITYLPRKLLEIRVGKQSYRHYDASQFFAASLERASQVWLQESKANDGLDVTRFDDQAYIREHWDRIIHYGKKDAELVARLFRKFATASEELDVPVGAPYSTGYLAEQSMNCRFRRTGNYKPRFGPLQMQELAWDAYRGGRFEVAQRGEVGRVVVADINSAYPHVLRSLPDPGSLSWRWSPSPSWEELEAADYGTLRIRVWTDPTRLLQPFPLKRDRILFPVMEGTELAVDLETFRWARTRGYIQDAEILEGWLADADSSTRYPFRFLEELYDERLRLKQAGEMERQAVLKIVINSVYGKLCQCTEQRSFTQEFNPEDEFPYQALRPRIREYLEREGLWITRKHKAGSYFNPFLATHVTALTRLQLLDTATRAGMLPGVVMLATDSVMIQEPVFDSGDFRSFQGTALGEWDVESRGSAFVVGSGVYKIDDEIHGKLKTRTRGFEMSGGVYSQELGDLGLRKTAEMFADQSEIKISSTRPTKIPAVVWQGVNLSQVGVFQTQERGISAGMDRKRIWPRGSGILWRDLLEGCEISEPIRISEFPKVPSPEI